MNLRAFVPVAIVAAISASALAEPFPQARKAVDAAAKAFRGFDRDQDGVPEIGVLNRIADAGKGGSTVLVLVESRVLRKNAGLPDVRPSIKTLVKDLAAEGRNALAYEIGVYQGPEHQDGLTLLALRNFFRRVWLNVKDFEGVLLVGDFPQPFMVRQYAWRRDDQVTILAGTKAEASFKQPWIRAVAEPVVSPADIVLADMDGRWDRLYVKQPMNVTDLYAVLSPGSDVTENWEERSERYEDFFFVQDGPWAEQGMGGRKMRFVLQGEPNEECTAADKKLTNAMAQPEIAIGRIDARHAGLVPNPAIKGVDGKGLLDEAGNPRTVEFASPDQVPGAMSQWVQSEAVERRLLVEFFARNHAYRTASKLSTTAPGEVSTDLGSGLDELRQGVPGYKNLQPASGEFLGGKITLTDVVNWLKKPMLIRQIRAHSNPWLAGFEAPPDVKAMEKAVGPRILFWSKEGNKLVPSLNGVWGELGFGLLRNLYENRTLPPDPVFYFHTGCESMRPLGAENEPFNSPGFARWQLAECTLMLGNGLALVGRGKVFYDEPREFWQSMGEGGTFGEAWKRYFAVESKDAQLAKDGIGRKRAYFWSVIGDFTLRLPKQLTQTR